MKEYISEKKSHILVRLIVTLILIISLSIVVTIWGVRSNIPESIYYNGIINISSVIINISSVIIVFYVIFPEIEDNWINYLKEESIKSDSIYLVTLPLIFAIVKNFVISITRFLPMLWGEGMIGIGSNQAIVQLESGTFEYTVFHCIFPAVSEELLFRFLPYIGLFVLLKYILNIKETLKSKYSIRNLNVIFKPIEKLRNDLFYCKKTWAIILWITITATIFAMAHGPNISNFYLYFTGGMLYGWLYLKYGLISSILGHMLSNYLSPIILQIVIFIISRFIII